MGMADIAEVVGVVTCVITQKIRSGLTATAISVERSRFHVDLRFAASYGLHLSMDDIRDFRQLHSRTPGHQNMVIRRVLKPPPARWGRAY